MSTQQSAPKGPMTLTSSILEGILAYPKDKPILTFVDVAADGEFIEKTRTYSQLSRNGEKLASALLNAGMQQGDAFALLMLNTAEFVDAMVGSELAKTVFVPIDARTKVERLIYMLNFTECKGVIVGPEALPALLEAAPSVSSLEWIWTIEGKPDQKEFNGIKLSSLDAVTTNAISAPVWDGGDLQRPMQFLFTSGTTGDPKAMLVPHLRFASVATLGPLFCMQKDDVLYTGLSLTHANAQLGTLGNALSMQIPAVFSRKFTKSRLWEIIHKYQCTYFNLLGGMTVAIYAEPESKFEQDNPVRVVLSAGMPAKMWQGFQQRFGVEICEIYGAAEGGMTINPPSVGPIGSIGKPPPGFVCAIKDQNDDDLAAGEKGEIVFKPANAPMPPVTYHKNPEASEKKTAGGWFRTGDIGYMDEDGWLYFCHRMGSAIRRNGDFINPGQVETEMATLADIDDVYVYGLATASNAPGEREVIAAVVLDQALQAPEARIKQLFAETEQKVGKFSAPSFIQLVAHIPKTASEKPVDRQLIQMITDQTCGIYNQQGKTNVEIAGE